ncbi:uncharacterized protein PV09_02555 [Verruconis gallopava]|uniref:MT-A70-domain-containing protein n=1 Tax=Verruconis gallopava TaxID=253628 RepID=A0A0D2B6L2_9PEZI|nr:uncharacterized protein PV09_02555 [Verruconis gallopava]KIW06879.1 hypothetical protein PV09_02555 [Verruconis gallopava]
MLSHPILYQNGDASVTLIDIPASIGHAHGFEGRILSCEARHEPFHSTEPKTQRAKEHVLARTKQSEHDVIYAHLVDAALSNIRDNHQGAWVYPRWFRMPGSMQETENISPEHRISKLLQEASKVNNIKLFRVAVTEQRDTIAIKQWDGTYCNDCDETAELHISGLKSGDKSRTDQTVRLETFNFSIPPQSSFLLADCIATDRFRNFVRWMSQEYNKPRNFNFILLDPPWENRSAKRRAAYETNSVHSLIENMDLSNYLAPGGFVAIWVTNKSAHRELVLGAGGIFESLNVSLVEEWIWIKTTAKGEPVMPVDGLWRKPYEVLLLARAPETRLQLARPVENVTRRILAAVPDFHSRKPCIKTLIEPLLPENYQALEVFARYLVQGWTSWGNEVLKYNHESTYETKGPSL